MDPQKLIFDWLKLEHKFFSFYQMFKKTNSFARLERATLLKTVQNDTPKINFFVCRKLES